MRKKNEIQRPVMWWVIEADRKELRNEPPSTKRQCNRRKRTPQESVFFESFQSYQVSHRDVWESIYNRRRPKIRFFSTIPWRREKTNEKKKKPTFFSSFYQLAVGTWLCAFDYNFFFCFFLFDSQVILVVVLCKLFVRVFSIGRWDMRWEEVLRCIPVCTLCMMSGLLSHAGACSRRYHHRLEQLLRRLLPGPPPCHQHLSSIIFRLEMWWPYKTFCIERGVLYLTNITGN
jgi:hypothetical protein